jgi:2-amino-4-hydroxy-6-hydroxymethyldihydropteridine diphosphokinase
MDPARKEFRAAWLSLGGNEGDVEAAFRRALNALAADGNTTLLTQSSLWRTAPWGKTDQAPFLNMVVNIETRLEPLELLERCMTLEVIEGRIRRDHWGPRPLDIDMLMFEGVTMNTPRLTLPHPRKRERAFVMLPLAEMHPDMLIGGIRASERARLLDDGTAVRLRPLRA